jgi:hypothetical protein
VPYLNPQSIQQAVQFALSVQEAEKQERINNSFYTRFKIRLAYSLNPLAKSILKAKGRDM